MGQKQYWEIRVGNRFRLTVWGVFDEVVEIVAAEGYRSARLKVAGCRKTLRWYPRRAGAAFPEGGVWKLGADY